MVASIISGSVYAKDFGIHGPVWEITEPSILDLIKSRLTEMEGNGELYTMRDDMQETTKAYVARPHPVKGLSRVTEARQFEVDLSVTLTRDLRDHRGQVFVEAGTRVNPLNYSRFNKRIVFFDGDDPAQVAFALEQGNELDTLLVLVNGAPIELTKAHRRRFYFDQDAQMVTAFNIQRVPSEVFRGDQTMIVREVVVPEYIQEAQE